jgi:hypothetical protein
MKRLLLLAPVLAIGPACALFDTSSTSGGAETGMDGDTCARDLDALSRLWFQDRACTEGCPAGSHCDEEAGLCASQCSGDSDCGPSSAWDCDCQGRCLAVGDGDTDPAVDPTCPKDLERLQDAASPVQLRRCNSDRSCPYGAHCDEVTRHCEVDCLADSECTGEGERCLCNGTCGVPGAVAPAPPLMKPVTKVGPAQVELKTSCEYVETECDASDCPPGEGDCTDDRPEVVSVEVSSLEQLPDGTELRAYVEVLTLGAEAPEHNPFGIGTTLTPAETVREYRGVAFSASEEARLHYILKNGRDPSAIFSECGVPEQLGALIQSEFLARFGGDSREWSRDDVFTELAEFAALPSVRPSVLRALKYCRRSGAPADLPSRAVCAAANPTTTLAGRDWAVTTGDDRFTARASFSVGQCDTAKRPVQPLPTPHSPGEGGGGGDTPASASTASALSAGSKHVCALLKDGGVRCWGDNSYGQVGVAAPARADSPVAVAGLAGGVVSIAAGHNHTCALLADARVQCWGYNNQGQLGNDTLANSTTPVFVKDPTGAAHLSEVTQIAAGGNHTCAVRSGGALSCWGTDAYARRRRADRRAVQARAAPRP